jgi:hypothetical protein
MGVVAAFAILFAVALAWRGYRRGALATVVGWLPVAAAAAVAALAARLAWAEPARLAEVCLAGGAAALGVLVGGTAMVRAARRRARRGWSGGPALRRGDRLAGAALGLCLAAALWLGLACLASTVSFAVTVGVDPAPGEARQAPPPWAMTLRRTCCAMADVAHFGLLRHLPRIGAYGREVRALVRILNAPREELDRLARKHDLTRLAAVPEVQEALLDEDYVALTDRVGQGDLSAIPLLAESSITRRLFTSLQVRRFTRRLTPSKLAEGLHAADPAGLASRTDAAAPRP